MKRIKTCLRTPGGKFYGFKKLKKYFDTTYDEYREPFLGGGNVYLSLEKKTKINWVNDIDKDLVNFYKVISNKTQKEKLYKYLKKEIVNKVRYKKILDIIPKDDVEKAYQYFYLNRTSFSGIMNKPRWGYKLGSSVTPEKWIGRIEPVSEKIKKTKLTSLDFVKVINKKSKNNVLIYCDPPYYKVSKGIYKNEFNQKNHEDLCNVLKNTKFKFILSYNYHEELLKMYKWAFINSTDWKYFMSEGRRTIGKELIITNFTN